jgi:iron complex transport system substrate-binding protein
VRIRGATTLVALCLLAGACGSESDGVASTPSESSPAGGNFPVTISAANGTVTLAEQPTHIVSLSATATEMLFAIGAGDQVTAVDDNSNYPPEAPTTKLSGFEPNVEAIAGYEPDLVIYSNDPGDLQKSLDALKIPALDEPAAADLDDSYAQMEELGVATGHEAEAAAAVDMMKDDVAEVLDSLPETTTPLTYYHELDDNYFTVTSKTFIGQVYSLLGLENIADAADKDGSGYPQLSAEYIVKADPDLIFLADTKCCHQSAKTVGARPGWGSIAAVESGGVVPLDDDIASRWGPRVVDFLQTAGEAVEQMGGANG